MKRYRISVSVMVAIELFMAASAQENTPRIPQQQTSPNSSSDKTDQQIQLGNPVHTFDPVVPKSLYGKKGVAVLGATIKTDGTFTDLSALTGDRNFEDAALDAVHQWRYMPATLNGSPIDADVFIILSYAEGEVRTTLKPNPPFPTKPRIPVNEQISRGELFTFVDPHSMKLPKVIYSPDPEYSETARYAKYKGTCVVGVILGKDGNVSDLWIARKLGLGLDQKALEAVRQWKFEPAMKGGEAVPVLLNVEVV